MAKHRLVSSKIRQWIERYGARVSDWPLPLRPCLLLLWWLPAFRRQWHAAKEEDRALAACYEQLPTLPVGAELRRRLLAVAEQDQVPARQPVQRPWRIGAASAMASLGLGLAIGLSGGSAGWLLGAPEDGVAEAYLESTDQYLFSSYEVGEWLAGEES